MDRRATDKVDVNPALSKEEQDALVDAPDLKQWH